MIYGTNSFEFAELQNLHAQNLLKKYLSFPCIENEIDSDVYKMIHATTKNVLQNAKNIYNLYLNNKSETVYQIKKLLNEVE